MRRRGPGGGSGGPSCRRILERAGSGGYGDAAAGLARDVRLDPSSAAAHEALGTALLEAGRHAAARSILARAMRLGGDSPDLRTARGRALSGMGRRRKALKWYRLALEMDPAHMDAHERAALELDGMGRTAEAAEQCDRAIEADPSNPAAYVIKADLLADLERDAEAAELYDRAAELDPASAEAHAGRARLLWRGGGSDEDALASIREAIRLRPGDGYLRRIEARMLKLLGRRAEAIESFARAVKLGMDQPETMSDMGEALDDEGRAEEALDAYGEAARASDDGFAHLMRGRLLAKLGRHREAIADFDESLRMGMHGIDADLYKGRSLMALGDAKAAARVYKAALEEFPVSAELNEGMADALGRLGRAGKAARYGARAREYAERNAQLFETLRAATGEDKQTVSFGLRDFEVYGP